MGATLSHLLTPASLAHKCNRLSHTLFNELAPSVGVCVLNLQKKTVKSLSIVDFLKLLEPNLNELHVIAEELDSIKRYLTQFGLHVGRYFFVIFN